MIGTYYLVRDLVVSTGAILGAYLWKLGPALNFLGAAALGVAGTIFYVKTIRQSRQSALNDLKKSWRCGELVGNSNTLISNLGANALESAEAKQDLGIPRLRSE